MTDTKTTSIDVIEARVDFIIEQMREMRDDVKGIKDMLNRDFATKEYVDGRFTLLETKNKPYVDITSRVITLVLTAVVTAIVGLVVIKK